MARVIEETQAGPLPAPAEVGRARRSSPSPEEGRRLVVAFMGIKNAVVRDAIIDLIEKLSWSYDDSE